MNSDLLEFLTRDNEKIFYIKRKLVNSLVIGVDEAGRGPVIGPMVMACYGIEPIKVISLLNMGVDDSKKLTRTKRDQLYDVLVKIADILRVAIIPPKMIDNWVSNEKGLNRLEAYIIVKLCNSLTNKAISIFIDSPSKPEGFKEQLEKLGLQKFKAESKADSIRPAVAAASIIAKVIRDRLIDLYKKQIGVDFGSGYPSDAKTKKSIPILLQRHPELIRKSWKITI